LSGEISVPSTRSADATVVRQFLSVSVPVT